MGVVPGVIGVQVGVPSVCAAAIMVVGFFAAQSISRGFGYLMDISPQELLGVYVTDPLGYLWVGAGIIASAVAGATGMRK